MNLLLAISIFLPPEVADLRVVLNAMHQLVGIVETEWAGTAADRALAASRMKALTLAIHDANDGLSYLANAKTSGTRAQTVTVGLQRIRQHAVAKLDSAIALGAPVQAQRDALAGLSTLAYATWQPTSYPAFFDLDGNYDAANLAGMKASEAMWHLYWDAANYATPEVSPVWSGTVIMGDPPEPVFLNAEVECGQSVRDLRDLGRSMVRARAIALGAPILGDLGTREEFVGHLLADSMSGWVDLQIAEYGKNGCIGTLADLNGGEWTREAINWRAPKAIGVPDTDNRAAEWFSDFLGMADLGPWVAAALLPASSVCLPCGGECPTFEAGMVLLDGETAQAMCVEVSP